MTARIARFGREHALDVEKHRFGATETPAAEQGDFLHCLIHVRS
ncbi:MAG: hypothetical protein VB137_04295 [Burkholderia sp.]